MRFFSVILLALLTAGCTPPTDPATELLSAARGNLYRVVRYLTARGVDPDTRHTEAGLTALMAAAESGSAEVVEALLEAGAEVNLADAASRTALSYALRAKQAAIANRLLAAGAVPRPEEPVVSYAAALGDGQLVSALLDLGADVDAVDDRPTARRRNLEPPALLLRHAEFVDLAYRWGRTPLMHAAGSGHGDVVRALLAAGAGVDRRDVCGGTALIAATESGHHDVMRTLLAANARPDAMDDELGTALFVAVGHGDEEAVGLLLVAGADPNLGNRRSITPLMLASVKGTVTLVEQLLVAGADLELRDDWGGSAIFYAVKKCSLAVVELLIRSRADVRARDAAGIAVVDYALRRHCREPIAARLQQAGAEVTAISEVHESRMNEFWYQRDSSIHGSVVVQRAQFAGEPPDVPPLQEIDASLVELEDTLALWEQVPRFPWPPPKPSASHVLDRSYFAGSKETVTFRVVGERLATALHHAGYFEIKWYAVPQVQGFAIVSRLEQINADGTPKQEPSERWLIEVVPPKVFSLASYLKALFTAQRGYFRILVFAVSRGPVIADATSVVDRDEALAWIDRGASNLPASMLRQPFTPDHVCTALVYEFEQISRDSEPHLRQPSPHQGRDHLRKAGVLEKMEE